MLNNNEIFLLRHLKWNDIPCDVKEKVVILCNKNHIDAQTFCNRMRGSMSINEALEIPCCRKDVASGILAEFKEYDTCTYSSVTQISNKYKIKRSTLYYRYNQGWSIDEIVKIK